MKSVIVVTGLPRSGTSMMMRMLESGGVPLMVDGIRKADPDNPYGYYEYEPVKTLKRDSSWVADAQGKAVKMVYLLLRDLPRDFRYDVIFMRRDLEEVVASQEEMLRRGGAQVSPDETCRMIALFRDELRKADEWLKAREYLRVLDVDYNVTINSPDSTVARINEFLDLGLDVAQMQSVVAQSLYRQRRAADRGVP